MFNRPLTFLCWGYFFATTLHKYAHDCVNNTCTVKFYSISLIYQKRNTMTCRNENGKKAYIKKNENGIFWLYENNNGVWEQVDGDRRLFVVKEMAKNWNYKIIKQPK